MMATDDMYKKEFLLRKTATSMKDAGHKSDSDCNQGFHKKLGTHLLVIYQLYLKKATSLEPDLKMAVWRMISMDGDFAQKITHLVQLHQGKTSQFSELEWEEANPLLFPFDFSQRELAPKEEEAAEIATQKELIKELLEDYY